MNCMRLSPVCSRRIIEFNERRPSPQAARFDHSPIRENMRVGWVQNCLIILKLHEIYDFFKLKLLIWLLFYSWEVTELRSQIVTRCIMIELYSFFLNLIKFHLNSNFTACVITEFCLRVSFFKYMYHRPIFTQNGG